MTKVLTPREVESAVDSLRQVGGVYDYIAARVEHDNSPAKLAALVAESQPGVDDESRDAESAP